MYRELGPDTPRELRLAMLCDPIGDGNFRRACESDSWRGLVGALLGDPTYPDTAPKERMFRRLRLAQDASFLGELVGTPGLRVGFADADGTLDMSSDETLIRSLDRHGLVSLDPASKEAGG